MNATDRDIGVNAIIRFSLDDTSNNLPFTLVGDVIQVNGQLDFEQRIIYSVSKDQLAKALLSSAYVTLAGSDSRGHW